MDTKKATFLLNLFPKTMDRLTEIQTRYGLNRTAAVEFVINSWYEQNPPIKSPAPCEEVSHA